MKPDTICLNLLVDESCFMQQHAGEMPKVLDRFLGAFRRRQTTVSCSVFSEQSRNVFTDMPIDEVRMPAIKPVGQSALLESACRLIDEIGDRLAATPEEDRPEQVVVAIFTAGQDSVSDFAYSKELLQEKIRHQSDVYSWRFVFPVVDVSQFHPTVVRIREPIKKTTFQFAADLVIPLGETAETVFTKAVDFVYEWINLKLGASTPSRERFAGNVDFDQFILPSLKIAAIPEEGHWACRMIHADEAFFNRPAIAGLTWTSDIALHRQGDTAHFAIRIFVTASSDTQVILPIRPRLVSDIGKHLGFTEGIPFPFEKCGIVGNDKDIERLFEAIRSPRRQVPVVLVAGDDDRLTTPLFERQDRQSVLYFGYVVTLPESFRERWTQTVGDNLSVPAGGVRIYYPFTVTETETAVGHPCYVPEEIDSWHRADQYGKPGFAAFLKETLADYAATKPADWGRCLFYPRAHSRQMEIRREQLADLPNKEYVDLLEKENMAYESLKKEFHEKESEIKRLEQERFELKQRLEYQYRSPQVETVEIVTTTKISCYALDQLEKITGKQRERIEEMIAGVSDEAWQRSHSHRFTKTDLKVFKDGMTNPAWIAGFFKDDCFHVTHIFSMQHGDYMRILNQCRQCDVEDLGFIDWTG